MKLSDISPETLEQIRALSYDQLIEKHELYGYEFLLEHRSTDLQFFEVGKYTVLTPHNSRDRDRTIVHQVSMSKDERILTLFYTVDYEEATCAHFIAICKLIPPENFYIALVLHRIYDFTFSEITKV